MQPLLPKPVFEEKRPDMKAFAKSVLLLAMLVIGQFAIAQNLEATEKEALLNVVVTDFEGNPKPNEVILFERESDGKAISKKTTADGTFQVLLPKGQTYKIKYQAFLKSKESSSIEIPDQPGYMEATLTVEMENVKEMTFELDVHFDVAKASIKPESFKVMDELVLAMQRQPETKVELAGHTDSDGDDAANLLLSQQRADAVKDYLVRKGIASSRISTVGYGERKPVASNQNEAGKARNRRTEVRVVD
jgi:outer membrane protein OmpA-like peptidoglycan-associated protein